MVRRAIRSGLYSLSLYAGRGRGRGSLLFRQKAQTLSLTLSLRTGRGNQRRTCDCPEMVRALLMSTCIVCSVGAGPATRESDPALDWMLSHATTAPATTQAATAPVSPL